MRKIPLSKGGKYKGTFFALVDDEDFEKVNVFNWSVMKNDNTYYAMRVLKGKAILMHRMVINTPSKMQTDHIDGDGLNNQKKNLRICTVAENSRNRRLSGKNTSGFRGVAWIKKDKRWRAMIKFDNKSIWLGQFTNKIEAAEAYNKAREKYYGDFAKLNLIT